ncbi:MAG: hypothetical protein QHJ73_19565, partial [Armatimonadota bacterium]|nr:hypothetical protein [Armatimonadota bacterium]
MNGPSTDSTKAARLRALAPLYASAWVANLCAFLALGSVVSDQRFTAVSVGLITLGFAVSLALRLAGVSRTVLPLIMAGATTLLVVAGGPSGLLFLRGASSVVASILPALVLSVFLVVFSFCLLDDDLILFTIPPGLTVLGLSGTENPNTEMTAYFLVFVVAVIFALSYQNYLRYASAEQTGRSGDSLRPVLRWQLVSAAALFTLMAVVTAVAALPLKRAGRLASYRFGVPAASLLSTITELGYDAMGREIRIGQGPPGLGDREILQVQSEEYSNWRARTYDEYTGRGWYDATPMLTPRVTALPNASGFEAWVGTEGLEELSGRSRSVKQRFTFLGSWPAQSLPVV